MSEDILQPSPVTSPESQTPVCAFCGEDPARISCRGPLLLGKMHAMIIYCGNPVCRKIWTVDIVKVEEPRVVAAKPNVVLQ